MNDLEQWNPCLLLRRPDQVFEIQWRVGSLSFVFCFADDAMILGPYLILDRLFDSVMDLEAPGSGRRCRPRKSPQWLPLESYSATVKTRPAWALK